MISKKTIVTLATLVSLGVGFNACNNNSHQETPKDHEQTMVYEKQKPCYATYIKNYDMNSRWEDRIHILDSIAACNTIDQNTAEGRGVIDDLTMLTAETSEDFVKDRILDMLKSLQKYGDFRDTQPYKIRTEDRTYHNR